MSKSVIFYVFPYTFETTEIKMHSLNKPSILSRRKIAKVTFALNVTDMNIFNRFKITN